MPIAVDTAGPSAALVTRRRRTSALWRVASGARRRITWGLADQAVSSVTNFAVSIYIARTLGALQFGAFSLAYVTYSFAINASRGLATDPLLVRFSGTDDSTWRRAVSSCTGTALVVGIVGGLCLLVAGALLRGTTQLSFLALGLTLPGLMLQDSWRFSFFAVGRGGQALLNDAVWAVTLVPALILLRVMGDTNVFWYVFAWGLTATVGGVVGPLQARVRPRPSWTRTWLAAHRDLGPRYLAEGTTNSASNQLRGYGVGIMLGLAAVGYVQAATTLMGPIMVLFFGMGLVALPEAARVLHRSPQHLPLLCVVISSGLGLLALGWGGVLLVALPHGLGHVLLHSIWRPTYPLILPVTLWVTGGCVAAGAGVGLHALGAARRSLRAMIVSSIVLVILTLLGAGIQGVTGTVRGAAIASWIGALCFWWQLRASCRESDVVPTPTRLWPLCLS